MKVIAYLRVSTELQDTDRQLNLINRYCETNKHTLVKVITEKVSGAKANRKGLNELLECDNTIADMVIVSEQSRFSREKNIVKVLINIADVLENGLDLIFLDNPSKIYKAGSVLDFTEIITLLAGALVANQEREKITERMKTGKQLIYQLFPNAFMGGLIPYGFHIIDNPNFGIGKEPKQLIELEPVTSKQVKELFERYSKGESLTVLFRELKAKGCPLRIDSLTRILKNPVYTGKRKAGSFIYNIKPLISQSLFDKVQLQKKENKINPKNNTVNPNILKGLLKCQCGFTMSLNCKQGLTYYICHSKMSDNKHCSFKGIKQDIAYKVAYNSYFKWVGFKKFNEYTQERIKVLNNEISLLDIERKRIDTELLNNKDKKAKVANALLYAESSELKELYNKEYNQLIDNEKELNKSLKDTGLKIESIKNTISELSSKKENVTKPDNDTLQRLYNETFEKIIYNSSEKSKGIMVVIYKNGLKDIYLINNGTSKKGKFIVNVPNTFDYDVKTGLIYTEVADTKNSLRLDFSKIFKTRNYNYTEFINTFDLQEWYI